MNLDHRQESLGVILCLAILAGCSPKPVVPTGPPSEARVISSLLQNGEQQSLSKLVLVAMPMQGLEPAKDLNHVAWEIGGTTRDGSILLRIKDSREGVDFERSVASQLKQKLLNNYQTIRITAEGKIELFKADVPGKVLALLAEIPSAEQKEHAAIAKGGSINLSPKVVEQIVTALNDFYASGEFKPITSPKNGTPRDAIEVALEVDGFLGRMRLQVESENSTILQSRRALRERDSGVITRKSLDGTELYIAIGEIAVMPRADFAEYLKNRPPLELAEKNEEPSNYIAYFGDKPNKQLIDIQYSFLRRSEKLVIVQGEIQLRKAKAFMSGGFEPMGISEEYQVIKRAPFPEFTPAVIAKTEVGKIISNRKLLQRIHDFICDTKQEEAKLMSTPPTSE